MSMSSMGMVDFRSDKERIARSTRQAKNAAKAQNKLLAEQNKLLAQQRAQPSIAAMPAPGGIIQTSVTPQGPPPGWYPDTQDTQMNRWWDGIAWTDVTQPKV
jgi:hypothetical protein